VSLLVNWVLFPVLLVLVATGCGLLVDALSRARMPAVLLPGVGLAALILILQLATISGSTVELAVPAALAAASAGFATALPRLRELRPDPWAAGCALAVFAVFAAPVVLSGDATFAGYVKLDDTSSWLGLTDQLFDRGYTLSGLPRSTYEAALDFYLSSDYPVAVFTPLGLGHALTGQDVAWLWQPYLATLAAMLALALYSLCTRAIESRPARALACFVAAQPALLFGFYLWGGVKELAAAWTLALMAALVPLALDRKRPVGRVVPLAVVSATTLAILSVGGGIWVGPVAVLALAVLVARGGTEQALRAALVFGAVALVLALPELLALDFLSSAASSTATLSLRLANLIEPLSPLQAFGIWPVHDFRVRPDHPAITYVLVAVVVAMLVLGAARLWEFRRRDPSVAIYVVTAAVGCLAVTVQNSPWFNAKALATAGPAFLLCALIGIWSLRGRGRRVEAGAVAVLVIGGVLWSNALGYQGVNLGPRERMDELREAGELIGDAGPTLMLDYEPYGVRHFLRHAAPEGASELRRRTIPLRSGVPLEKGEVADLDAFQLDALLVYRTMVLRASPTTSRPPAPYRRLSTGRWYEVWQRPEAASPRVLRHMPLGTGTDPGGRARCPAVLRLARVPGVTELATVRTPFVTVLGLDGAERPSSWRAAGGGSGSVFPESSGTLQKSFSLTSRGPTVVWVGGAFRGRLEVSMDGRSLGARRHLLSHGGEYVRFGQTELGPGRHRLTLRYEEGGLHPGSAGGGFPIGPVVLAAPATDRPVQIVDPADARSLCGQRLDWVEALG
jgi:hypothetical protein